jgi:hypothetical protein
MMFPICLSKSFLNSFKASRVFLADASSLSVMTGNSKLKLNLSNLNYSKVGLKLFVYSIANSVE